MAARHHAGLLKSEKLSQRNMGQEHMNMVAVFEYMIGNTDWAVPTQHNIKIIKVAGKQKTKPCPVPYDFDYTGIVNAIYAIPPDGLPIEKVRERLFLGYCQTEEAYQEAVDQFLEQEEDMYQLVREFPHLQKNSKADFLNYLEDFFNEVRNAKSLEKLFSGSCKK